MKTDTSEKGLEAHITQHFCLVNAFEERHFSNYNRVDCVDDDFTNLSNDQKRMVKHIKTSTATKYTAIAKAEREKEHIWEYKEPLITEAKFGKRNLNFEN